jgi:hypothetical protein
LGASSRVRFLDYEQALCAQGVQLAFEPLFGDDYVRALYAKGSRSAHAFKALVHRLRILRKAKAYDAIWVEKEMLPWLPSFVELSLLPVGVPLVVDYDDAVFHRYDLHSSALVRSVLGSKIDRIMARADLVVAGNGYLADHARMAGAPRVEIVPTVVDTERYSPVQQVLSDCVTIGWIGSPITAPYLDIVKPVIASLARAGGIRAVAIGARPDQVAGSVFEAVPWSEESEVSQLRKFDIGIMPLWDTPWERGKCGYKLIQYMALGLPVVASPVGVNCDLIVNGKGGYLASNDAQWAVALDALINSPVKRVRMGTAGRTQVNDQYSLHVWATRLANLLKSL